MPFVQCECTLPITDDRWADRDHSRRCALRDCQPFVYRRLPVPGRPPKRQSGSLRPGPAFHNSELSSPQEEASDLAVGTTAGAVDELRQPVRAHALRVGEQMRRRSPFVRTAPPASFRHVQPSDVCFHLAALPNFASSAHHAKIQEESRRSAAHSLNHPTSRPVHPLLTSWHHRANQRMV